jgi:hypothetical protein
MEAEVVRHSSAKEHAGDFDCDQILPRTLYPQQLMTANSSRIIIGHARLGQCQPLRVGESGRRLGYIDCRAL